ncbi:MAG TPA: hypothetical protein PLH64_04100 [Anaerolineaceae bacterium]|nr:hypothetical protein [Anaerolineaceae bacterium]
MIKKRLILTLIAALALLTGCVRTSPAITSTPEPTQPATNNSPTSTPTHLSPLYKLHIFVGGHGWASNVDQTIFYNTRNFGEHWLTVTPAGLVTEGSGWGAASSFPNGDIGWICRSETESSASFYTSTDGGREWQTIDLDFPCGQISVINADEGFILSDQGVAAGSQFVSLYHTADGGKTWDLRFEHDPADPDDHGLPTGGMKNYFGFLSSNIGVVGGYVPVSGSVYLYRTVDGGTSWIQSECQNLPLDENQETSIDKIIRINATTAVLPVRSYLANGNSVTYFCSTTDAADSWQYVGMLENVEFLDFGSQLTGVAYGQGKMFHTSDGGLTWTETTLGLPPAVTPISLDMINDLAGFLIATITPETLVDNRIYMTGNNGKDWQPIPGNIIESTNMNSTP